MAINAVGPLAEQDAPALGRLFKMAEAHARLMMEETSYMRLAVQHAEMSLALEGRTPRQALTDVFSLRQRYEAIFESVIDDGVKAGEFRDVNPSLMAKACLGSLNWMSVWYRPGANRSRNRLKSNEIATEFAEFVTRGLQAGPDKTAARAKRAK
jgi:hypothetical protein